ncbi:MAG: mandelate racemase [Candidatus Dormibacteraeota bacterium]|uniref:glucarate dehydratase n=1 Tax=Candidatus Dormiibacter inghamiae TaxID=3127013 RepID=A0A934KEC1_9BACT|nr:mandelate racemase [Candidatus Dormibacteraeota bacterium]MBJ7607658.1 mandelate racemase [Candidatus Dormibacteraeota bacterium]
MRIADLRATTVSVPLEAPLLHSNGTHWGRFVRTVVEVETEAGMIGLGELGGGGESAQAAVAGLKPYILGHNPLQLQELWLKLCNPTATLYNNRLQLHAAIEFACLDLAGQVFGVPLHQLLGGSLRERIPFASYLFFRYPSAESGAVEVRTVEQLVDHASQLKERYGFTTHKLKGGVFPPSHELACYRALAGAFPDDRLRFDPNGALSMDQALAFGRAIESLANDYYEDPTPGLNGMRQLRARLRTPLATNMVVVGIEQLAANVLQPAVDVVLLDTTLWGGIRPCLKAAAVCETFQIGVGVHSSGELGIQLATMLHLGAVLPNLSFAADAHYHQLADDIIAGGKLAYAGGEIAVPSEPGLGVRLDRERLAHYAEEYQRLGGYEYDRDPARPGWYARPDGRSWADPTMPLCQA